MNVKKVLDAKGFACPLPIVRTKKAMKELETGEVLEVQTTDKGSQGDLTAWAKSGGHEILKQLEENGVFTFWIQKA